MSKHIYEKGWAFLGGDLDPTGKDIHTAGAKMDSGKPLAGLVLSSFVRALKRVIDVGTYGAKKYSPRGWLEVPDAENRYRDALYRHLLESELEEIDPESGIPHIAHAAWNLLAMLEFRELSVEFREMSVEGEAELRSGETQWPYKGAFSESPPKVLKTPDRPT